MTGSLDTELRQIALDQIADKGKAVTWIVPTGTYVVAQGKTPASSTSYAVNVVVDSYDIALVDGSTIQVGDLRLMIAASGLLFTPAIGHSVVIDGVTLRVLNPRPLMGSQVIAWEVQCRK